MRNLKLLFLFVSLACCKGMNAQFCFNWAPLYWVGQDSAYAITSNDFNNDGKADLAVAGYGLTIELGDGNGHFAACCYNSSIVFPYTMKSLDLNADGNTDLVTVDYNNKKIGVALGTGNGMFGTSTTFTVSNYPYDVACADFNGDNITDMAVAIGGQTYDVEVFLGTGTGNFNFFTHFAVVSGPSYGSILCSDFNEDGKIDLAYANAFSGVTLCLGTGTGNFGPMIVKNIVHQGRSMISADFNNDGHVDLATANMEFPTGNVSVLLGNGNGGLTLTGSFAAGASTEYLVSGDFDLDGKPDIATTNAFSQNMYLLKGSGTGSFAMIDSLMFGAQLGPVISNDFNNDGKPDLSVALANTSVIALLNCGAVGIEESETSNETTVYPNPAINELFIETSSSEKIIMNVLDVNAKIILSKAVNDAEKIDVSNLDNGVYTLSIKSNSGVSYRKLIIQK